MSFIDTTVYCYKMIDGEKVLTGTQAPFPEHFTDGQFSWHEQGEKEFLEKRKFKPKLQVPAREIIEQTRAESKSLEEMAEKHNISISTMRTWCIDRKVDYHFPKSRKGIKIARKVEKPSDEQLFKDWVESGYRVNALRKKYKTHWNRVREWLLEAGILGGGAID